MNFLYKPNKFGSTAGKRKWDGKEGGEVEKRKVGWRRGRWDGEEGGEVEKREVR